MSHAHCELYVRKEHTCVIFEPLHVLEFICYVFHNYLNKCICPHDHELIVPTAVAGAQREVMPSEPQILLENRAWCLNSRVRVIINLRETDSGTLQRTVGTEISETGESYLQQESVKYFSPISVLLRLHKSDHPDPELPEAFSLRDDRNQGM